MAKPITKRELIKVLLGVYGDIDAPVYLRIGKDGKLLPVVGATSQKKLGEGHVCVIVAERF